MEEERKRPDRPLGDVIAADTYADRAAAGTLAGRQDSSKGPAVSIASAATITIPPNAAVVTLTGTVTITSINPTYNGHRVTFLFAAATPLTDGSGTIRLASAFTGSTTSALHMICDGTKWIEQSRTTGL